MGEGSRQVESDVIRLVTSVLIAVFVYEVRVVDVPHILSFQKVQIQALYSLVNGRAYRSPSHNSINE